MIYSNFAQSTALHVFDENESQRVSDAEIDSAIDEIKLLPFQGLGIVSGDIRYNVYFSKLLRLDIAPSSRLTIGIQEHQKRIFICAEEVFVQCPSAIQNSSVIGFQLLQSLAPGFKQKAPNGAHGAPKTGQHGGDGSNGLTGENGKYFDAPTLYFVFKKLTIQNATPGASNLLKFDVNGVNGGDGGQGGDGGDAGNGGQGTDARNGSTYVFPIGDVESYCEAGPGPGGNTGKPGSGGKGGDAARGGNGGHVVIICPQSEAGKVAFAASFQPGQPGTPGQSGRSGARALAGSGGELSRFCRDGRPGGAVLDANPDNFGMGATALPGQLGSFQVHYRDTSDIFTF